MAQDSPSGTQSVRDVRVGSVMDLLSWLRSATQAVVSTPAGSSARRAKLEDLSRAVVRVRASAVVRGGRFRSELRVALAAADLLLRRLLGSGSERTATEASPRQPRPNPRFLLQR